MGIRWTEEEEYRRMVLRNKGKTCEHTARALNRDFHGRKVMRTAGSVRDRQRKRHRYEAVTEASLLTQKTLMDKGLSANQPARAMGLTKNTVMGRADRACLKWQRVCGRGTLPVSLKGSKPLKTDRKQPTEGQEEILGTMEHEQTRGLPGASLCRYPALDSGKKWTELTKAELKEDQPWGWCDEPRGRDEESYCENHARVCQQN